MEHDCQRSLLTAGVDGDAPVVTTVNALSVIVSSGAAVPTSDGLDDFSYSAALVDVFYSLIASSAFSPSSDTFPPAHAEPSVLLDHVHLSDVSSTPQSLRATAPLSFCASLSPPFDLSKESFSYLEAMACPDASVWQAAMDHECQSLIEMGVF